MIRCNWHFYVLAILAVLILYSLKNMLPEPIKTILLWLSFLILLTTLISLLVSFYVYDISKLYELKWLPNLENKKVLNINAGFDETSKIIEHQYPKVDLTICDFYNPEKHTEVSIKRARKAYPPHNDTITVATTQLPFQNQTFDYVFAILSAHEIRDEIERVAFFNELTRVLKPSGHIFITEHLRDVSNFMGYTIGFFHFHSKSTWLKTFQSAKLYLKKEIKTTPFITTFIVQSNGNSL